MVSAIRNNKSYQISNNHGHVMDEIWFLYTNNPFIPIKSNRTKNIDMGGDGFANNSVLGLEIYNFI